MNRAKVEDLIARQVKFSITASILNPIISKLPALIECNRRPDIWNKVAVAAEPQVRDWLMDDFGYGGL